MDTFKRNLKIKQGSTFNDVVIYKAGDDFEIDEHHHRALLIRVKHKAYGKKDSETFDGVKADQYFQEFKDDCMDAKRAQGRLRRHVAVVRYGGL